MVIKRNKCFPYPVLMEGSDDYIGSEFTFDVTVGYALHDVLFTVQITLSDADLAARIAAGQAEYLLHIECPQTCCRVTECSSETAFTRRVPANMLRGKVTVCCFIVAREEIWSYRSAALNPDYAQLSFSFERGGIMAIGGQYDLFVEEPGELGAVPSIFSICKLAEDGDDEMVVNMEGQKIAVALREESYRNHQFLVNMPGLLPVFHAVIIAPVLTYVLETLRQEGAEMYEELRWYRSLSRAIEAQGQSLEEMLQSDTAAYLLAQRMLDGPVERALRAITAWDQSEEEE